MTLKYEIKELANGLKAALITLDGQEGMTLPEVITVLGIPEQTVRDYVRKNKAEFPRFSVETARTLRKDNVIPMTGRPPSFVPKTVIEDLVRYYPNPTTNAIYRELWEVATAVKTGDVLKAANVAGADAEAIARMTADLITYWSNRALEEKARAEEAIRTKAHINAGQMATAMGTAGAAVKKVKQLEKKLEIVKSQLTSAEEELGTNGTMRTASAWMKEYSIRNINESVFGRRLAKISREMNLPMGSIKLPRFQVLTFHIEAIRAYLREYI